MVAFQVRRTSHFLLGLFGLLLSSAAPGGTQADEPVDPQIGQSFRVPYRRTLTNHYLVRVRINGKGPFNFLVDTGAPALFVGTEAAKAAGLEAPPDDAPTVWSKIDNFAIEGGIELKGVNCKVWDAFQLVGMNALGLPGARIDGILGYTVLARFRMQFDPRSDRMTWTRLDFQPKDPYVPENPKEREAPGDVQAMEMLGPMMQFFSLFIGKQPEDVLQAQGLLGIELAEGDGEAHITKVLPDTPAARAGLQANDILIEVLDKRIEKRDSAHAAIAKIRPGDAVELKVRRSGETLHFRMQASEGL
jgi:hypothetical protein